MLQVVWLKRDLRLEDHAPLWHAARAGEVLCIYCFEPSLLSAPDQAEQHQGFVQECLMELKADLWRGGIPLSIHTEEVLNVLHQLKSEHGGFALWSHEETGNALTFARDRAAGSWCAANGILWTEFPSNSVVRRLKTRDRWSKLWIERMSHRPLSAAVQASAGGVAWSVGDKGLGKGFVHNGLRDKPGRQRGGRAQALTILDSFLNHRALTYRRAMSSPLSAQDACSRLSPYLAYGCLSIREIIVRLRETREQLLTMDADVRPSGLLASLHAFEGRLHWHCHFIQKLESEPEIETRNMHRAYDGLRDLAPNPTRIQAWAQGETGFPMIDACMKMLHHTGWINFRMRAMLVSFSSYQLWQHWPEPALHLAREFLDYEPGIHYPQMQMQSGTTGINTVRIYNPVKQARDQDPDGSFVRAWIPSLARLPNAFVFEPWLAPQSVQREAGCVLARDYPEPIVDHVKAAAAAREKIWAVRRGADFREQAALIFEQHGSRRPGREARRSAVRKHTQPKAVNQGSLF